MESSGPYYGHSGNDEGTWHLLADHIRGVARLARVFSAPFDSADRAELAAMLHDLGKYGCGFQRRLRGEASGIDHWSAGAWVALTQYRDPVSALVIQGHHIGLQRCDKDSLLQLDPSRLATGHPLGLELSELDPNWLLARIREEVGLPLTPPPPCGSARAAAGMLDARMLYSTIVDADFLDTEAHFRGADCRPDGVALQPARAIEVLQAFMEGLRKGSNSAPNVQAVRDDLHKACSEGAARAPGVFSLTAPTGAGKTLAMLSFALEHARRYNLGRIVFVIPYLTIIEQTASTYRFIFESTFGPDYVLEHHSLAGARERLEEQPRIEDEGRARLLAENWDAPIVVTTSVQFLESLFSNRPGACRKLHRLARSVILFDEVQTLPVHLAVPTLATLGHLAERYQTSIVISTATQPAFEHLSHKAREVGGPGWNPHELARPELRLFERTQRTCVHWPDVDDSLSWDTLSSQISGQAQVLCVVNLKRQAEKLVGALRESNAAGVFHLSTSMCPAHRVAALDEVRARLRSKQPCRLISTQCIEAGVDVDFPTVYRAFGPLEAIAQAAGRCNREGLRQHGKVIVFFPELDDREPYPTKAYAQAAAVTRLLLVELGAERMDITSPELFESYYRRLYNFTQPEAMRPELIEAIKEQDFPEVSRQYRLIEHDAINVLVPYDLSTYAVLAEEVRQRGLTAAWMRRAQTHAVSVYRPTDHDPVWDCLEVTKVFKRKGTETSDRWFIYTETTHYDPLLGLKPPEAPPVWVF